MINAFINEYNKVFTSKISLQMQVTGRQSSYKFLPKNFNISINRKSIQSSTDKYIEEIKWGTGNNMPMVIGLNPSQSLPSILDKTNELITYAIYMSSKKYDGYYLINLYSHIQTKKFLKSNFIDQTKVIKKAINFYTSNNKLQSIDC